MELVKAVMFVKQIHAMHSFFTLARNNAFFMCIDRTCSNSNGWFVIVVRTCINLNILLIKLLEFALFKMFSKFFFLLFIY